MHDGLAWYGFASLQSTLFFLKKSAGFGEKFKQVYNNFVLVYMLFKASFPEYYYRP